MALLYFSDKYETLYNCSFYNFEEKPFLERSNIFFGYLNFFTATVIWISYIPCIIVMLKADLIKYPCYKLMVFLAILDLNGCIYAGFWSGIVNLTGNVYCNWPKISFIMGCLHAASWKAQTTATVLLALNRCVEYFNKNYAEKLFYGKRIYFWMAVPIVWGLQDIIWGPPGFFSPVDSVLSFNPHEGYIPNDGYKYFDHMILHHNRFIAISIPLIYGIFGGYIFIKSKNAKSVGKCAGVIAKVFGQILLISLFLEISMIGFTLSQYHLLPRFLNPWMAYLYLLLNGLPAFIYLTLNKTIRSNILKMFGIGSY